MTKTRPTRPSQNFTDSISADGDCFVVAANIVALFDCGFALTPSEAKAVELARAIGRDEDSVYVTHGYVTRATDNMRHIHAWVEIPDVRLVLDFSNGNEVMTPIAHYYKAGKINEACIQRYTHYETRKLLVKHEHYGPWEDFDDAEPSDD